MILFFIIITIKLKDKHVLGHVYYLSPSVTINTVPLKKKTKSFDTTILYINEPDHCVLAKNLTLPGAAVSQDSLSPGPVAVGPAVTLTAGSAGSGGADSPGTHHSTYSNITCHIASQYHYV